MSSRPLPPGSRLRQVQSQVDELDRQLAAVAAELARLAGSVETLHGELSRVGPSIHANLDALRAELAQVAPSLHANLDSLRGELSQVSPSLHANLDDLRAAVAQLRAETEGFRAETGQLLDTRSAPGVSRAMTRPLAGEMVPRLITVDVALDAVAPGWRDYVEEYTSVAEELSARYRTATLPLPTEYAIEALTSRLLYVVVRTLRPETVLESGVANGHSTFLLLTALERNGSGRLHSTDIRDDVGGLLDARRRSLWSLHRVPLTGSRDAFSALVAALPPIDLFLHDSDHSYGWQRFEFQCIAEHLAPGGLIVSDDADATYAFLDHCELSGRPPLLVHDGRKILGLVQPQPA